MATLLVFRGDSLEREIELGVRPLRIGRSTSSNDVVLTDPDKAVSRSHAELRNESGVWVLTDLGSQNGIVVDGNRVERAVLHPNVAAMLGPFRLMVDQSPRRTMGGAGDEGTVQEAGEPVDDRGYSDEPYVQDDAYADEELPDPRARRRPPPQGRGDWFRGKTRPLLLAGAVAVVATAVGLSRIAGGTSGKSAQDDVLAQHLTEARVLIESNEPQRAITEHLNPALALDPENVEAADLKSTAEAMINAGRARPGPTPLPSAPQSPSLPPTPRPPLPSIESSPEPVRETPVNIPPESGGLPRLPGETNAQLRDRERRTKQDLDDAKAAASRGDLVRAEQALLAIVRAAGPAYLDANAQLMDVRRRRSQAAKDAYNQAVQLENNQRWDEAIRSYQEARRLDDAIAVEEAITRVSARKIQVAESKLREADGFYKLQSEQGDERALRLYQEVVRLLPDTHPRYAEIKKRIAELER